MSSHGAEAPNTTAIPLVKDIFGVSADFLGQLRTWFEQNPPAIPVTQLVGFTQFTAQSSTVTTGEGTVSVAYADLATVGPQLTNLPDGKYVLIYGCVGTNSVAGNAMAISVQVNSTAATDTDWAVADAPAGGFKTNLTRAVSKTLSNGGNNTVTCKYRISAGTGNFSSRWLLAFKYANA